MKLNLFNGERDLTESGYQVRQTHLSIKRRTSSTDGVTLASKIIEKSYFFWCSATGSSEGVVNLYNLHNINTANSHPTPEKVGRYFTNNIMANYWRETMNVNCKKSGSKSNSWNCLVIRIPTTQNKSWNSQNRSWNRRVLRILTVQSYYWNCQVIRILTTRNNSWNCQVIRIMTTQNKSWDCQVFRILTVQNNSWKC